MYTEEYEKSRPYRQEYLRSVKNLIEKRRQSSNEKRFEYIKGLNTDTIEKYREDFINILGWPLNEYKNNGTVNVKKVFVYSEEDYDIYRMQFEIFEDYWFYGLFFEKKGNKNKPLVICQHGGLGTPEMCSSIHDTANYHDMVRRVLKYDVNVFAPQMLLWNTDKYGDEYDRGWIDEDLKHMGGSLASLELYSLKKAVDYFDNNALIKDNRLGMIGLSYGGFFTMTFMAVEKRVRAGLSCSYFNNRYLTRFIDWKWRNSADYFMDAEIALLSQPRFLLIAVGDNDELFDVEEAKKEYSRLTEISKMSGFDISNINFEIFKGIHEFPDDDKYIDRVIGEIISED